MFYGEFKDGSWGATDSRGRFKNCMEISDGEWNALVTEANSNGKIIGPDENGYPTLKDPPEPTEEENARMRLSELKAFLSSTDYIACKIAEDSGTKEEYAEVILRREEARREINAIQEEFPE